MSRLYQTTNVKHRASHLRSEGKKLQAAGFEMLASINFEEADWIDPPEREYGRDVRS